MSRDSSPPPLSDDSAVGSMCTGNVPNSNHITDQNNINNNNGTDPIEPQQPFRPSKPSKNHAHDFIVRSNDLQMAANQMLDNTVLISCSLRNAFPCLDDLDMLRFEPRSEFLINFVSNGTKSCSESTLRPVSILWPNRYKKMVEQLSFLDSFLLNTGFREEPVSWMIKRGLATVPNCRQCKDKMVIKYDNNVVRWQCQKTQACCHYYMSVLRSSFFCNYENVELDKLLFSIYFWSICITGETLYSRMNIAPELLNGLWRRMQNVCQTALEKSYPRHRLTNYVDNDIDSEVTCEPIDLISIRLNDVFIVCAKHPSSNLVRLGLHVPTVSMCSFVDLTESWFAHGAHVRFSEIKFMDLSKRRTDLKLQLVSRSEMVAKDERFCRETAFGYIISQLAHVFKDINSASVSRRSLGLTLAEMEWREIYGRTPYEAFTNIVTHMAQYGGSSNRFSDVSKILDSDKNPDGRDYHINEDSEYVYAEKHFYASVDPIDSSGNIICRYAEKPNNDDLPLPDVRITCHECKMMYECFEFSLHIVSHVERNRKEINHRDNRAEVGLIECKHCFNMFSRRSIDFHSALFRAHLHTIRYGCRICCLKYNDRSQYLQHMRIIHFQHETPYRCPSCKFASSFQRDVFIHFQEEHRHSMIVMCPLCLRSFTVKKPGEMNSNKMKLLSKIVYDHIADHYALRNRFSCSNCCLSFLDQDKLHNHRQNHHNPMEIHSLNEVKVEQFAVTAEEEKHCVKALPTELFIPNKRPNVVMDIESESKMSFQVTGTEGTQKKKRAYNGASCDSSSSSSSDTECSEDEQPGDKDKQSKVHKRHDKDLSKLKEKTSDDIINISDSEDETFTSKIDDGTILVRGLEGAEHLLDGGRAAMSVSKSRSSSMSTSANKNEQTSDISSEKLIEYLSKMLRIDGLPGNQATLSTPDNEPAKCCECLQLITVDHFVAEIFCKDCRYRTHCPRAATNHFKLKHATPGLS